MILQGTHVVSVPLHDTLEFCVGKSFVAKLVADFGQEFQVGEDRGPVIDSLLGVGWAFGPLDMTLQCGSHDRMKFGSNDRSWGILALLFGELGEMAPPLQQNL